jgi:hypothetical protein
VTPEPFWSISHRLLGIYFVVEGALAAVGTIGVFGVIVPEGSSQAWLVASPLAQSLVALVAGAWLLRRGASATTSVTHNSEVASRFQIHVAVQLLGTFFFIGGLISLARPLAGLAIIEAWQWRLSELAGGAVGMLAGAGLAWWPRRVQAFLETKAGA